MFNFCHLCRMTLEGRGVWSISGAHSRRLVWFVRSQDQTACRHTSTSYVSARILGETLFTDGKTNFIRQGCWSAAALPPRLIGGHDWMEVGVCEWDLQRFLTFTWWKGGQIKNLGGCHCVCACVSVWTVPLFPRWSTALSVTLGPSSCLSLGNYGNWPQHSASVGLFIIKDLHQCPPLGSKCVCWCACVCVGSRLVDTSLLLLFTQSEHISENIWRSLISLMPICTLSPIIWWIYTHTSRPAWFYCVTLLQNNHNHNVWLRRPLAYP